MKLHKLCIALIVSFLSLSNDAFAIDQIILKSGAVVEGKILNEEPNLHVDIELTNGTRKRYEESEIQSVERDVPSNKDSQMTGNSSIAYIGGQLGLGMNIVGATTTSVATTTNAFTWGFRGGVNVAQLGDFAKFALGISYTNTTYNPTLSATVSSINTLVDNQIMAQILFRKIGGSGFYIGPELGAEIITNTVLGIAYNGTVFSFGGDMGYDLYLSQNISLGPDIRFDYAGAGTYSTTGTTSTILLPAYSFLKIMATLTYHF